MLKRGSFSVFPNEISEHLFSFIPFTAYPDAVKVCKYFKFFLDCNWEKKLQLHFNHKNFKSVNLTQAKYKIIFITKHIKRSKKITRDIRTLLYCINDGDAESFDRYMRLNHKLTTASPKEVYPYLAKTLKDTSLNGVFLIARIQYNKHQNILNYIFNIAKEYYSVDNNLNVKMKDDDQQSILYWAIACHQPVKTIQEIIEKGGNLNEDVNLEISVVKLIHYAITLNQVAVVKLMIKINPELQHQTDRSEKITPLLYSINNNHADLAEFFYEISNDKDIINMVFSSSDLNWKSYSALHLCAFEGHTNLAKMLIRRGANIHLRSSFKNYQAIHLACQRGNLDIVELLIKEDIRVLTSLGQGDQTPLHIAVAFGQIDIVKLIVNSDSHTLNAIDSAGYTPLLLSIHHPAITDYLLSIPTIDATIQVENNGQIYDAFDLAIENEEMEVAYLFIKHNKQMIDFDFIINVIKSESISLLKKISRNHPNILKVTDADDMNILIRSLICVKNINIKAIDYILEASYINVDAMYYTKNAEFSCFNYRTALHFAALQNDAVFITILRHVKSFDFVKPVDLSNLSKNTQQLYKFIKNWNKKPRLIPSLLGFISNSAETQENREKIALKNLMLTKPYTPTFWKEIDLDVESNQNLHREYLKHGFKKDNK